MPRHERILGIALVLAVALPPYLTAPLRARADIIDDLLDAAGDFVPPYKYLKEAYDFYGKYVAGQPVIPNVQAAINAAKTQIVAELDALAAADVTACANTVVNTFQNIQLLSQDNLQNFAIQSAGCLNLAQADIAAASDKAAIDKLGFALNTVGPLTLIANAEAGFATGLLKETLINGNRQLLSKLQADAARASHFNTGAWRLDVLNHFATTDVGERRA